LTNRIEHMEGVTLHSADCLEALPTMADASVDSCVCDPPYHLTSIVKRFGAPDAAPAKSGKTGAYARASRGFMGKQWDGGDIAFRVELWAEVFRVLKPGAHLVAFSGTRTYHRMVCAIEDAGFEIRDQIGWCFGSGFPKSHDVSKGIDRAAGAEREVVGFRKPDGSGVAGAAAPDQSGSHIWTGELRSSVGVTDAARQWQGWGTALKPAWEPIVLARKPLIGTVAANVLAHGTGAINIAACRVATDELTPRNNSNTDTLLKKGFEGEAKTIHPSPLGRWPANIVHDGSDEVVGAFPHTQSGYSDGTKSGIQQNVFSKYGSGKFAETYGDEGSAARFFYTAKADADDRLGSKHPTVKPLDLMQWLVRLVTPPGGTVLDPFAGTGTTGEAAFREGFRAVLIEREPEYQNDIRRRMSLVLGGPDERRRESIKASGKTADAGPLFGGAA
jgi:DNA modification methylase